MKQLRDEHDRVCGPTTSGAVALLRDEPHRTSELEYTTAVVKETLRLFPVGFVTRINDKDSGGVMTYKSRSYPTGDFLICSASHTVHYDETVFPEPGTFFPTRWLPSSSPYPPIPRAAFRSFEVGPRACLGRDMAMDQLRALLLLTVRWFDFELAATESSRPRAEPRVEWFDLDTKIGDMAYQDMGLEAKPRGGVKMRVRRTGREF
jgi:cytochrome P450